MKKWLAPVIVAGVLCGNLALCEAKRQDLILESKEINEDYIYFYELVLSKEEMSDKRKIAYKNSYRTFMLSVSEENFRDNPELYKGLIEEY